jgi:glycosyltransferase involved in cell wall biosynthesis
VPIVWQQTVAPISADVDLGRWRSMLQRSRSPAVRRAERVVVPSETSLRHFVELFGWARERVEILPYYLPALEPLAPGASHDKLSEVPGPRRLLFVGKEARRKGLPAFVEAWAQLDAATRAELEVTVVSDFVDGPVALPPAWRRFAFVEDLYALMRDAHVLVFPTLREAYGLVLVEAMASGMAVITTAAPIQRDIVGPDGGLFVDPRDAQALAAALSDVAKRAVDVAAMARANLDRFRATLWHEVVGPAHLRVFRAAAAGQARAR